MTYLAQLVLGLFTSLFTFFGQYITKRLAILTAFTALLVSLIVGVNVALKSSFDSLFTQASPPTFVLTGLAWLPSNTGFVVGLMIAGELTLWVYRFSLRIAGARLFGT